MNIDNKIRADLFRNRIEDKNQLTGAGAIYVGTGIPKYISSTGEIIGEPLTGTTGPFYETVGVTPTSGGQVPVSIMGTGSAEATGTVAGLAFKSVNDAMKDVDENIALDAKGFNLTANGTMNIESNVCNLTATGSSGSFVNVQANRINLKTSNVTFGDDLNKTTLNNVGEISFPDAPAAPPYVAPSGTLDQPGGTPYEKDTGIYTLTPIISNISARLDSLGFKEEVVEDSSGNNLLTFRKIGYYVLVTLEQSISVVWEADDFYCNVPQAFQKQKKETKTLFSIYLKASDRDLDTVVSISYRIDDSEHTIEFKNQDAIYNPCIDARFNKGIIFGYDIRE